MTENEQIQDLLDQINKTLGINFRIEDSSLDDTEIIRSLKHILQSSHSSTSKDAFLRSLLLGMLNTDEIIQGAHQHHLDRKGLLFPLLLTAAQSFSADMQSILGQYFSSGVDSLIYLDEYRVVVLHHVTHKLTADEMRAYAEDACNLLETESMISITISYSDIIDSLDALPKAFLDISSAAEIGKIFYPTERIFWSKDLGMGELIYHLPREVCENYIEEHFGGLQINMLDEQTRNTISVFLDSGLNIAECARRLYLHRNTLIYRLDKIQQLTGLDIRNFDDAMTCKVAILMSTYLLQTK